MFKPKYRLTEKLLNHITQIERGYGQLEALRIPKKLEINFHRDNLIQSVYASNSIEGNPLSLREVTNLLLGDRLPVNRDEKEVTNYFNILKDLKIYLKGKITLEMVEEIHRRLMSGVNDAIAGQIRNKKVVIGKYSPQGQGHKSLSLEVKHEPPSHQRQQIKKSLQELINWVNSDSGMPIIIKAGCFHHHFVYIHPFTDGNGRVGRLLTALIFIQNNYQINKYFVLDDYYDIDRILYSDQLHSADQGDKTEWLEYFSEGVMFSLQAASARVKDGLFKLKVEERPTNKERQVLEVIQQRKELTSTDLVKVLKVSRQQAHSLLKSLVEKGFLSKKGKTKRSYYFLK